MRVWRASTSAATWTLPCSVRGLVRGQVGPFPAVPAPVGPAASPGPREAAGPGEGRADVEPTADGGPPTFATSNSSLVSQQRRNPHDGVYNVSTEGRVPERVGRRAGGSSRPRPGLLGPTCSPVIGSPEPASLPSLRPGCTSGWRGGSPGQRASPGGLLLRELGRLLTVTSQGRSTPPSRCGSDAAFRPRGGSPVGGLAGEGCLSCPPQLDSSLLNGVVPGPPGAPRCPKPCPLLEGHLLPFGAALGSPLRAQGWGSEQCPRRRRLGWAGAGARVGMRPGHPPSREGAARPGRSCCERVPAPRPCRRRRWRRPTARSA